MKSAACACGRTLPACNRRCDPSGSSTQRRVPVQSRVVGSSPGGARPVLTRWFRIFMIWTGFWITADHGIACGNPLTELRSGGRQVGRLRRPERAGGPTHADVHARLERRFPLRASLGSRPCWMRWRPCRHLGSSNLMAPAVERTSTPSHRAPMRAATASSAPPWRAPGTASTRPCTATACSTSTPPCTTTPPTTNTDPPAWPYRPSSSTDGNGGAVSAPASSP